jgi:hypothetical protein
MLIGWFKLLSSYQVIVVVFYLSYIIFVPNDITTINLLLRRTTFIVW